MPALSISSISGDMRCTIAPANSRSTIMIAEV